MSDLIDVDEWWRWLTSRRGRNRWRAWADDRPALRGWRPHELVEPRWSPPIDRLQHDLVALAQDGQGRAAMTLLVQLRPGLLRLVASRRSQRGESRSDACDEVRAAFHETLYLHRLDRRPRRIAANLVLDTRQRLSRADRGGRRPEPIPAERIERIERIERYRDRDGPSAVDWTGATDQPGAFDPTASTEARSALRWGVERLPGSARSRRLTAELALRAWILDQPHGQIAEELGLTSATVATRLHRLRTLIRRHWGDDGDGHRAGRAA